MDASDPPHTAQSTDPTEPLLWMLNGHCLQQALHVVAVLGIADRFDAGPQDVESLAAATGTHQLSLQRLMRALAAVGVFEESPEGEFALTPLGTALREDAPGSIRDRALYYGSEPMWGVWGELLHSVRTGESACARVHGVPFYEHLLRRPEAGGPFNRYMGSTSERHTEALLRSYDFSSIKMLVDVGGGLGGTLAAILNKYPEMRGITYDIPAVAEHANAALLAAGLSERSAGVGGNMLSDVPPDGDAYLLKWVLMDRGDAEAVIVLRNCAAAMARGGRVVVVEMAMPSDNRPSFARVMDLQMMLLFGGGRIRTEAELCGLLGAAGLKTTRVLQAPPSPNLVLEGQLV